MSDISVRLIWSLLALGLTATEAESSIIYTNLSGSPVTVNSSNSQYLVDLDGGIEDFYLYHFSFDTLADGQTDANAIAQGSLGMAFVGTLNNLDFSQILGVNVLVGSGLQYLAGSTYMAYNAYEINQSARTGNLGYWANGPAWDGSTPGGGAGYRGYLGLSFQGDADGQTRYAWIDVQINPYEDGDLDSFGMTVYGYAYETQANVGILTGDTGNPTPPSVPEPATLALMAGGLAALSARRRRTA